MTREEDIKNAVYDVIAEHLYDPVDYSTVVESVGEEYDESFALEVYNQAGAFFAKLFREHTGT